MLEVYTSNVSGDSLSSLELTMPISPPIRQACRTWLRMAAHTSTQTMTNTPKARLKLHPFRFVVESLRSTSCARFLTWNHANHVR